MLKKGTFQNGFCFLLLLFLITAFMTGCGTGRGQYESVNFHSALNEEFSPRRQPAQTSTATEDELYQQGYFKLGVLSADLTLKECWEDTGKCKTTPPQTQNPTTLLMDRAPREGGDLVVFQVDDQTISKNVKKNGMCAHAQVQKCQNYPVTTYHTECNSSGCSQVPNPIYFIEKCHVSACGKWLKIQGTATVRTSRGTLWRKDPEMAKVYHNKLKAQEKALKAQEEKALKAQEKVHNRKALKESVKNGEIQKIKDLLAQGADVNLQDKYENSPLHYAAQKGGFEIVQLMLEKGADPNLPGRFGYTPLVFSAYKGHKEVVLLLLSNGADPSLGKFGTANFLLAVSASGWVDLVKMMLDKGVDPKIQNKDGTTALHRAAGNGHKEIVRLLLDKGADPKGKYGQPIHKAAEGGNIEVVKLFLDHGADPNAKGKYGRQPIHEAAFGGNIEVIKLFLDLGNDINGKDEFGRQPISFAAIRGNIEVIKFLLEHGADVNAKTSGKALLDYAKGKKNKEMVDLLKKYGAK